MGNGMEWGGMEQKMGWDGTENGMGWEMGCDGTENGMGNRIYDGTGNGM